jgi:hypothetical protein
MLDSRIWGRASLAGWVRSAGAKRRLRTALAAGSAAVAAVGVVVMVQPAGAATVRTAATAASSCHPKTNIMESRTNSSSGAWAEHYCGTGYRHPWHSGKVWEHIDEIWDGTSPSYRVWFHENGKAWCAWGSSRKVVPVAFRVPGNIKITTNTARCPS